jgi:hypothetical protein
MKKLILLFLLLIPAVFFSFGSSCDSKGGGGGTERGSFTYDGNTYPVHSAIQWDYGATGYGSYNLDFEAASAGIDLVEETGIGNGFYFELFSPNTTLASGTYNYNDTIGPFTFDYGEIYLNWDYDAWSGTYVPATGGTVIITVSGTTYTVEFTLSLIDGKTATGNYTGPAPIY